MDVRQTDGRQYINKSSTTSLQQIKIYVFFFEQNCSNLLAVSIRADRIEVNIVTCLADEA